jgi:hypothetical protein
MDRSHNIHPLLILHHWGLGHFLQQMTYIHFPQVFQAHQYKRERYRATKVVRPLHNPCHNHQRRHSHQSFRLGQAVPSVWRDIQIRYPYLEN